MSALNCLFSAFCMRSFSFSCGVSLGLAAPDSLPTGVSHLFSLSPIAGEAAALPRLSRTGDRDLLGLGESLVLSLLLRLLLSRRRPLL